MKSVINELKTGPRNWWTYECLGILSLLMGLFVFSYPPSSYGGLVLYFVSMFCLSGGMRLYFAFSNQDHLQNWTWYFVGGLVDLVLGLILVNRLDVAAMTLPFFVGAFLMFGSLSAIGKTFDLRSLGFGWAWLLALGIAGFFFSILILFNPSLGVGTVVAWTSLSFLVLGAFYTYLGFSFRKMERLKGRPFSGLPGTNI